MKGLWRALVVGLWLMSAWSCADERGANRPPELSPLPTRVDVVVGEFVDLTVSASDPDGDGVSVALEAGPEGAEFRATGALGRFYWAPLSSDASSGGRSHELIFSAQDSRGGRASARVVVQVEPGAGPPRFITSPQRVLDLSKTDTLIAEIAVKDDDSPRVALSLQGAPKGMVLYELSDKRGELRWTPDQAQVAERPVWTVNVLADDLSGEVAVQQLTVILIAKRDCGDPDATCGCSPPTITHEELPDQRGAGDYNVTAVITDAQSEIQAGTLFWTLRDPSDLANFTGVEMVRSEDRFQALIPNPNLAPGADATIFYFVCARDDDDAQGEQCDSYGCLPANGALFSFAAFSPGDDGSCRQDAGEPNDALGQATPLSSGSQAGRSLCPGDKDLYFVDLEQGEALAVTMRHTAANGALGLRLLDDQGEELLAEVPAQEEARLVLLDVQAPGVRFIEVSGAPNSYDLDVEITSPQGEGECEDRFEPNDSLEAAAAVTAPVSERGLRLCADRDHYRLTLGQGDRVSISATFLHVQGDVDLVLREATGARRQIGSSTSVTDNEAITIPAIAAAGDYVLEVALFGPGSTRYDLEITVESFDPGACEDDLWEPNNAPGEATAVEGDQYSALRLCAEDRDLFAVPVERGEQLTAQIEFVHGDGADLDLYLVAPDGEEEVELSETLDSVERVRHTARERGVYYVLVEGYQGSQAPYALSLSRCAGDAREPNDGVGEAATLTSGDHTGLGLCPEEFDWYKVTLRAGELLSVTLSSPALEDLEMILYASNGATALAMAQAGPTERRLSYEASASQEVLLRVTRRDNADQVARYDLTVQVIF
jgi:hypothetical protein